MSTLLVRYDSEINKINNILNQLENKQFYGERGNGLQMDDSLTKQIAELRALLNDQLHKIEMGEKSDSEILAAAFKKAGL